MGKYTPVVLRPANDGSRPSPLLAMLDRAADLPSTLKEEVRRFWEKTPCGTRDLHSEESSREFFDQLEKERDEREAFIGRYAGFGSRKGQKVLEVGVGAGTDFIRFVRAGAQAWGIDLTEHAVDLVKRRLAREGLAAEVSQGDAENLPFPDHEFDFVYSWGVVHHTPNTERAIAEIVRVTKPGGRVCVMVYHRHSIVALQCWILNALLKGRPWRSLSEVIGRHIESVGTKAYSVKEARRMFGVFSELEVTPVLTPYDLRLTRTRRLPRWMGALVPPRLGWFLVVTGRKS